MFGQFLLCTKAIIPHSPYVLVLKSTSGSMADDLAKIRARVNKSQKKCVYFTNMFLIYRHNVSELNKTQEENIMKKLTLIAVSAVVAFSSATVMAKSEVKKSVLVNQSINKGNATIAVGKDNLATSGSMNIKDSKVKKSVLVNQSINKGNATIAVGKGNTASTGSMTVE